MHLKNHPSTEAAVVYDANNSCYDYYAGSYVMPVCEKVELPTGEHWMIVDLVRQGKLPRHLEFDPAPPADPSNSGYVSFRVDSLSAARLNW